MLNCCLVELNEIYNFITARAAERICGSQGKTFEPPDLSSENTIMTIFIYSTLTKFIVQFYIGMNKNLGNNTLLLFGKWHSICHTI